MTLESTATVRSGVIGRPVAPRPYGNRRGSSRSKQTCWPVRGQTSAHAQPRRAKLTVSPEASRPLPWTQTWSWNERGTLASGAQDAS
ncbi:hypothetical protein BE08_07040 [Sorangium cellulosum]|uniref:Uncharacterized protein n=1 Tax=Sorangium cellulosum TaxID=56 RepID=A0A150PEA8_SORCE|nr:hypothetical protein BE08_07040 [Sorangium cellulosum]